MNGKMLKRSAILSILSLLFAAAVLFTATFAWFTSNRSVSTSRVETATGQSELKLYVRSDPETEFSDTACELTFLAGESMELMPVSTADLKHFVYCPSTTGDMADIFLPVGDILQQDMFCYGSIQMRAELEGNADASVRVAVYLDQPEDFGLLARGEENSLLMNGARLGIVLNSDGGNGRIFYLSEENNREEEQAVNTVINGELQTGSIVLQSNEQGEITPVSDPAIPLDTCMIAGEKGMGEPLFYLETGTTYTVDVFFYLEGCDPDCSDSLGCDAGDLGLAFYATLSAEG